jgi:GNAT superfamily N-acetyltransferase
LRHDRQSGFRIGFLKGKKIMFCAKSSTKAAFQLLKAVRSANPVLAVPPGRTFSPDSGAGPHFSTAKEPSTSSFGRYPNQGIAETSGTHMKNVGGAVMLKDGTEATVCILTPGDSTLAGRFYADLSWETIRTIRKSPCMFRLYGNEAADYMGKLFADSAADDQCVAIGVKAGDQDGKEKLVGLTFYRRAGDGSDTTCFPYGTVVADDYQGKGVAVAMKLAQIESARTDGFKEMRSYANDPATIAVLKKAAHESGLELEECTRELFTNYFETTWTIRLAPEKKR